MRRCASSADARSIPPNMLSGFGARFGRCLGRFFERGWPGPTSTRAPHSRHLTARPRALSDNVRIVLHSLQRTLIGMSVFFREPDRRDREEQCQNRSCSPSADYCGSDERIHVFPVNSAGFRPGKVILCGLDGQLAVSKPTCRVFLKSQERRRTSGDCHDESRSALHGGIRFDVQNLIHDPRFKSLAANFNA